MYCYIVYVQVMTKTQRIKRTPGAESLSPRVDGPSVWSHFCRPSPKNGAMIVNPGGHFHLSCLSLAVSSPLPRVSRRRRRGARPQKSSSSHMSRYTSKASRLQFPSGVNTYLWKVPSTHMAAGRGGGEKFQRRRFRNRSRLPSEVLKHLKWLWSNESRRCLIWCRSKQGDTRDSTPGVEWTMLRYSAAGMQIRATATETSRFKVHIIKSLIKSKWCNGPIEAGTDKEGPW